MEIKWNVPEEDLDGMEVIYLEIDGHRGKIVDVFNDGLTVQIEVNKGFFVSVPSVQVMTLDNKFIVEAEDTHHCENCDVRMYENSDASFPVYVAPKKCVSVCRKCANDDSIYFLCQHCGEWNSGEVCHNCGEERKE